MEDKHVLEVKFEDGLRYEILVCCVSATLNLINDLTICKILERFFGNCPVLSFFNGIAI